MSNVSSLSIPCSGYSVVADFYEGKSTDSIIFFCIGWESSRERYRSGGLVSNIIESTGQSAIVFDYSGHGESPFSVDETRPAQHFLEVIYAFDWLQNTYPKAEITVLGTSYGGFMATQLVKYRDFDNLILRVPAIYRPEDFYSQPSIWAHTEVTDDFRTDERKLREHPLLKRAHRFKGDSLIVVHERDELVPKPVTDAYTEALPKAQVMSFDTTHTERGESQEWRRSYANELANWISRT